MWRTSRRLLLITVLGQILIAGGSLRLKNTAAASDEDEGYGAARRSSRVHLLIQVGPATRADAMDILRERGVRILRPVPDSGYLVAAESDVDLSDAGFAAVRPMRTPEKVSRALPRIQSETYYVVEFHPDVEEAEARAVVARYGLSVREHPDLLPGHLLVGGRYKSASVLASADEVAYIFPASPELVSGMPVEACAGALTASGTLGQYIATYGDGWDGPGRNGAALSYSYARLTEKLPRDVVTTILNSAMAEWARVARLTFAYSDRIDGPKTINFLFAPGSHGDAYPFDGSGKVLAHTYYPAPPNPEPIGGDLHLDDDERWSVGTDIDLYSVVLHELGHALGLGHADKPGAVMYPYYSRVTGLTQDDVNAILQLYATADGITAPPVVPLAVSASAPASTTAIGVAVNGTVTGGSGPIIVRWSLPTGAAGFASGGATWSIAWIPLSMGQNTLTIQATDSQRNSATQMVTITRIDPQSASPQIIIASPAGGVVTQASVTVSGTASAASGISLVRWTNSAGGNGNATGTSSWSATVALKAGQNVITVTAVAADGTQKSANVMFNYGTGTTSPDTTAPTLTINSPALTQVSTISSSIRFSGTARDNVGVTEVNWANGSADSGPAVGLANWTADVPLLVGDNRITVKAKDAAGNVAWRTVVVTRR